jgi:DME family drug/metabolite transporter
MAIVVLGGAAGGASFDALGFGLALLAAAMQAFYVLLGRRGFRAIPSEEATFSVMAVTAVGYLLLVAATGTGAVAGLPFGQPATLATLAWAGVAGAGIPALLFLIGIRAIGPTRTSIVALLEPVFGSLLAAAVLGEALGPVQVAGGALVLLAAALIQRGGEGAEPHEAASGAA